MDTSAILALLVASDRAHGKAKAAFERLRARNAALMTTSYVLVELYALAARRLGLTAVAEIRARIAPLFEVLWVDRELHEKGLDLLIERGDSRLSIVDAVSLVSIRANRVEDVFAYDRHFEAEGFSMV